MLVVVIPLLLLGLVQVWDIAASVWPDPPTCKTEHTVEAGDTWYGLAKTYGDSEKTIWFNAGASAALSREGQTPNTVLDQPLQVGDTVTLYCGGPPPWRVCCLTAAWHATRVLSYLEAVYTR